jgi:hypothetical protein
VRALDGRDGVELDAREASDGCLDVVRAAAAEAGGEPLMGDDEPLELGEGD